MLLLYRRSLTTRCQAFHSETGNSTNFYCEPIDAPRSQMGTGGEGPYTRSHFRYPFVDPTSSGLTTLYVPWWKHVHHTISDKVPKSHHVEVRLRQRVCFSTSRNYFGQSWPSTTYDGTRVCPNQRKIYMSRNLQAFRLLVCVFQQTGSTELLFTITINWYLLFAFVQTA